MTDNFEIVYDEETGYWTEREKSYMTIEIPTKGDYELLMEKIDFYDKNHDRIEQVKKTAVKEFAEKLKQAICDNTYPYFDKNGKPVNIWNTDGFDKINELLKEYERGSILQEQPTKEEQKQNGR